ncbi:hypothetical protein L6164_021574 [Bauhinia variegata]|uniref:Uncharacterized protein n=1 Tax=Bauhinia variegata TaxID=167791 RepID=A0ACB9N081_BAUVA|nr:hypothetical protein L6164_021574 [Bauhinia variegata]
MGTFKLRNFTLVSLHLLLFTCNLTFTRAQLVANPFEGEICKWVSCGQGICQATDTFPGFQCNCAPGWTKFKIGNFEFPSCALPNCHVSLQCGNGDSSPPPPSLLNLNLSDPCTFTMCLDGSCEKNGTEFRCQCRQGSANLMNNPKFPCFKKCSLGGDCHDLDLGFGLFDMQPPPPSTPPQQNSTSPAPGLGEMLSCSRHIRMLIAIVQIATVFLRWI